MGAVLLSRGRRPRLEEAVAGGMEDLLGPVLVEWEKWREPGVVARWVVDSPRAVVVGDPVGAAAVRRAASLSPHRLQAVPRCAGSKCGIG